MRQKVVNFVKTYPFFVAFYYSIIQLLRGIIYLYTVRIWLKPTLKLLDTLARSSLKVNIGGGDFCRRGWKSLDFCDTKTKSYAYNSSLIDYNFNLISFNRLPFESESVKFFYSSHTLEHIPQEYCQHILNEIYRSLTKGGAVRLTMPDFDLAYHAFMNKNEGFFQMYPGSNMTEKFLGNFVTGLKANPKEVARRVCRMKKEDFANYYIALAPRSIQKRHPEYHINWWNYNKTKNMLARAGFKKVKRSYEQKSMFSEMRGKSFWGNGFDHTLPAISFFIEAVK